MVCFYVILYKGGRSMLVMDAKRMHKADAIADEEYGIPTLLLMERAADALMK